MYSVTKSLMAKQIFKVESAAVKCLAFLTLQDYFIMYHI